MFTGFKQSYDKLGMFYLNYLPEDKFWSQTIKLSEKYFLLSFACKYGAKTSK